MTNNTYIVLGRSNGTTKRNAPYCLLRLKSKKEEITIAVWDTTADEGPKVGQIVSFATIQEGSDGRKSARNDDIYILGYPKEDDELYCFIPRCIKKEQWDRSITNLLTNCSDEALKNIIREMAETLFLPYSKYPAATSVHHTFTGGLLNHTYQLLHMLEGLYPCLPYKIKLEHCILGILFHDYGKVYEYNSEGETQQEMYLLGHIYISANRLQKILEERNITTPEINRILHIILAHHGQLEYGSPVMPCTKEAILITHLDNISAKMDNIEITPHMERSFALATHVIKD